MIMPLFLAMQAAAASPGTDPRMWDNPPTEMVDFLGRRRLCAELTEPAHRDAGERAEAQRLRCAGLPGEERSWRERYAGNAAVRAWLDLDPMRFRMNNIMISAWHGPPAARPRRIEQSGTDPRTGVPYRLIIEAGPDRGGSTRITASFGALPMRSFTLDNDSIPFLDLQSLRVMFGMPPARRAQLYVILRYGYARNYCYQEEQDDRPEVSVIFEPGRVRGYRRDGENCEAMATDLPDAAPSRPRLRSAVPAARH